MFAFAIWDRKKRSCSSRVIDWALSHSITLTPTTVRSISVPKSRQSSQASAFKARDQLHALPDYLANHATSGEETLYRGVKRLLPGHTLDLARRRDRDQEVLGREFLKDCETKTRSDKDLHRRMVRVVSHFGAAAPDG